MRSLNRLLSLLLVLGIAQSAVARETYQLNIPAQPLSRALQSFAQQSGLSLVHYSKLTEAMTAPAVEGSFTAEEGLKRLLANSGLEFEFVNPQTVEIREKNAGTWKDVAALTPLTAGTVQLAQAGPDPVGVKQEPQIGLEEITVTAQKRTEPLQEVPMSISVLRGEELDQSTMQGVTEALNTVPSVTAQESYIGGGTQISVRGVSGSSPILHGSSPIAYYLDSVPFGLIKTSIAPDANAYDLQRVEVLRGPQGTLYGSSALNGVVRVLTRDADLNEVDFKARSAISGTHGGDANYRADAAVNIPLVPEKLAIRAVAGHQDLSGWIERPDGKNVNSAEIVNFRVKVNAQPTDALRVGFSTWLSRDDRDGPPQAQENDFHAIAAKEPQSSSYDAYGLTIHYDFVPFTVTSTSSFLRYTNRGVLNMEELSPFLAGTEFVNHYFAEVVAEEINLNSNSSGPWHWSLGGLYRNEKDRTSQTFSGVLNPFDFDDTSEAFAIYGELKRILFDNRLELAAGLRYFADDVATRENLPSNGIPGTPLISEGSSFEKVTPRAVITWLPNDELTVYASYGEGFRSGSQQQPSVIRLAPQIPPLEADSLTNYEVGAKGSWFSRLVSYEAAVYYLDWEGVQSDSSIFINGLPQVALVNGNSASGVGFDLSLTFRPSERWDFGVAFGRNELAYDSDVLSAGAVLFPRGSRLSMSPRTSAGGFLDYAFPLGSSGYRAHASVSANFSSAQYIRIADGVGQGDSIFTVRSSFTLDAPSNWKFSVYADNLTNEDDAIQRAPFFNAPDWTVRPRPRTIGLQAEYRY